jgi:hypothetical protein
MTRLFDRSALALHRGRASAMFLARGRGLRVEERLLEVNRRFTAPAV